MVWLHCSSMVFQRIFHTCRLILIVVAVLSVLSLFNIRNPIKLLYQKFFKNSGVSNLLTITFSTSTLSVDRKENESSPAVMESSQVKYCTLNSSEFQGRISINKTQSDMEELERKYQYLNPGGHHIPEDCKATSRVAIIVPYRDREAHLKIFLNNMHPFLIKQKLDYSIIVVEQIDGTVNRAKLLNIGFVEALKLYDWQCFIFHDVDILPEDDRNLHNCPFQNPRHMAVAVNKFGYKLAYERIFGASSALTAEQFRKVNGFSNRYWGWGGEDDDMYTRVELLGYKVDRYNETIARYTMLEHSRDKSNPVNPCRFNLMALTKHDWKIDGLNSLAYKLMNITMKPLFTHIVVDLLEDEEKKRVEADFCKDVDMTR